MNFIDSEKTIWILPERTATRTIGQLLNFWDIKIYEGNTLKICKPQKNIRGEFSQMLRHEWRLPDLHEDYELLLNIRNPYTRMKSYYYSLFLKNDCKDTNDCELSFLEFVDKHCRKEGGMLDHLSFEQIYETRPPQMVIRYENLKEDLLKVPFILNKIETSGEFRLEWSRVVENNIFDGETKGSNYSYTEEEAEKIYRLFSNQFKLFGYEEDSWRYL